MPRLPSLILSTSLSLSLSLSLSNYLLFVSVETVNYKCWKTIFVEANVKMIYSAPRNHTHHPTYY